MKMKNIVLYFTLFTPLLCLTSVTQAAVGIVPLGDLQFTNAVASTDTSFDTSSRFTIDGLLRSYDRSWTSNSTTSNETIDWTWQANSEPSLLAGESVSHYTYTINLYAGFSDDQSNPHRDQNWLIRAISLALGDPNSDNFTTITDYQSLSNTQVAQDHDHTISVDSNGLITTTEPNAIIFTDTYTVVFNSPTLVNSLRFTAENRPFVWNGTGYDGQNPGWSNAGKFALTEITGSATADVVPEPSAYALILGLIALGFAFKRRK